MSRLHQTLFISDLHIDESTPRILKDFLKLLTDCDEYTDALYILGDLFEVWIGDDKHSLIQQQVIQGLANASSKGLKIYFLPGNRDFLIGKNFLQQTGCELLTDESTINLYGTSTLLMHGDRLCTEDIAYIKARKILRHPWLNQIFLLLPLSWRKKLAKKIRSASTMHTRDTALPLMDVSNDAVISVMHKHQVGLLIHGHTHRPGIHHLIGPKNSALKRIVLGAWHDKASLLICHEDGTKNLVA